MSHIEIGTASFPARGEGFFSISMTSCSALASRCLSDEGARARRVGKRERENRGEWRARADERQRSARAASLPSTQSPPPAHCPSSLLFQSLRQCTSASGDAENAGVVECRASGSAPNEREGVERRRRLINGLRRKRVEESLKAIPIPFAPRCSSPRPHSHCLPLLRSRESAPSVNYATKGHAKGQGLLVRTDGSQLTFFLFFFFVM